MPEERPIQWVSFLFKFAAAFCQALWFQMTFRPRCLVAFGGYVSGPVVLSGLLFKRPTLLHEENLIPGRANRLLASRVTRMSLGFKESERFLERKVPLIYTGPVVRSDLRLLDRKKALDFFGLKEERETILVMGGSQGSRRINLLFLEALRLLPPSLLRSLQVIHLTGATDRERVEKAYHGFEIPVCLFSFLEAMSEAYSAADLVVGRGGAMTIAEIIFFRKPAVLIPLSLARGHQRQNIQALAKQKACLLLDEEDATPSHFAEVLRRALEEAPLREAMRQKLGSFETDVASERLAGEVLKLLNGVDG
jgi:UDP-N-acetylglucosamine--N-acetylmuramyl-(pentapeptide) pyrophosphoryl-undecaprenol N-acetylglucosamine transferase